MRKRRVKGALWTRALQALLAASCLTLAGCAAEAAMDEGEEEALDEAGDMAPDETGTTEEPAQEPAGDEIATEGEAPPDEAGDESGQDEEIAQDDPAAACMGYGQRCTSSSQCCSGLVCGFDGYIRYCRH